MLSKFVYKNGEELAVRLESLSVSLDVVEVHQTRIHAKRLRYLLEPAGDVWPEARVLRKELKVLQTLLGDLHDAQVFGDWLLVAAETAGAENGRGRMLNALMEHGSRDMIITDPFPGLLQVASNLRMVQNKREQQVRDWLACGGAGKIRDLAEVAPDC